MPSLRPAAVRDIRLVTDEATACAAGCTLEDAAARGLAAGAVYTYDVDTPDGRRYAMRGRESRVPPWQAFWTYAAGAAGTGAMLSVPLGSVGRPR